MAGSVNRVILIGNLGKDPEIRAIQGGKRVANLTVATSENWKDKATGERKERIEWHKVVIFNEGLVDVTEKYIKQGSKVYIEGSLQSRKWVDNGGLERYTTEIVLQPFNGTLTMLDGIKSASGGNISRLSRRPSTRDLSSAGNYPDNDFNDDIPI